MKNLNFDPIFLTQALVKCPSITPKDAGALDIVEGFTPIFIEKSFRFIRNRFRIYLKKTKLTRYK